MTCLIVASKESQFHELEFQNIDHSFVLLLIIGSLIMINPEKLSIVKLSYFSFIVNNFLAIFQYFTLVLLYLSIFY